jgi:GNAT superfamily N-acetyltransferase
MVLERDGVSIGEYTPEQSGEALELEKQCVQGASYRMSFRRSTFHRRAENYGEWRIFTARVAGRLVGITAVAIKDVTLREVPQRASFYFDARVHPELRGRGVGRLLATVALEWGSARSSFAYTYTLADNAIAARHARGHGSEAGGYRYLVYPVYRRRSPRLAAERASFEEVHAGMLAASPSFDLYANPRCRPGRGGYLHSWVVRRGGELAGCSAWSNRGIIGEVIESIPATLRIARSLTRAPLVRSRRWPHVPEPGEELRSWYLFDFFATDPLLARDLMRHVANEALDGGIDYCYLPHDPRDAWVEALRSDVPRLFTPTIGCRLLMNQMNGRAGRIDRLYVDVRDI